jgi:hypothetical protein
LENARVRKTTARAEAPQRVAGARLDLLVPVELAPKVAWRAVIYYCHGLLAE